MKTFAEFFAFIIDKDERTQSAIAEQLGISTAYLSDLKHGNRKPTGDMVKKLVDNFNLTKQQEGRLHELAARDRGFDI